MGEMLRETERAKGGNVETLKQYPTGNVVAPVGTPPTLASLGLTKRESAEAQKLAALPQETFHTVSHGALPCCEFQSIGPQAMVSVPPGRILHDSMGEVEGMGR